MNDQTPLFTIFVHVYYPAIWEEMARDLERLVKQPFQLVITRTEKSPPVAIPNTSFITSANELVVENRGRDILPFLEALKARRLQTTNIGLKLHTKSSPHRLDGADWRRFLLASLLRMDGENRLVGYELMEREHRVGLVAPEAHLLPLNGRTSINGARISEMLIALYGSSEIDQLSRRFAAGSMFWFRQSGIEPLVQKQANYMFDPERGQLDGTSAHAIERLFVTVVERQGFIAASIENATPILASRHQLMSTSDLVRLVEDTLVQKNQFAVALPAFWQNNPHLLKLLHVVYARLPKSIVRFIHAWRRKHREQ